MNSRLLHEHQLPVAGVKANLVKRVEDCYDTMFFEAECDLVPFQQFRSDAPVPEFESLPRGAWQKDSFPLVKELRSCYRLFEKKRWVH